MNLDTSRHIGREVQLASGSLATVVDYDGSKAHSYRLQFCDGSEGDWSLDEFRLLPEPGQLPLPLDIPVEADSDWNSGLAYGDRMGDYGHPIHNFRRIAGIWSAILGVEVTTEDVALCMIGLKVSREKANPKADNLDDIDGYVACLRMVHTYQDAEAVNG
jgi:hypothetical protein